MKTTEKIELLTKEKGFRGRIKKARLALGFPQGKEFGSMEEFSSWNVIYTEDALKNLTDSPGVVIDSSLKPHLNSLKTARDSKIKDWELLLQVRDITDTYRLPLESFPLLEEFLITGSLSKPLHSPYETYLLNDVIRLRLSGTCRKNDIQWRGYIGKLQTLLPGFSYRNRKPNKKSFKVTLNERRNELWLDIGPDCRFRDINWDKDVKPLQRRLPDFVAKSRPIVEKRKYEIITYNAGIPYVTNLGTVYRIVGTVGGYENNKKAFNKKVNQVKRMKSRLWKNIKPINHQ